MRPLSTRLRICVVVFVCPLAGGAVRDGADASHVGANGRGDVQGHLEGVAGVRRRGRGEGEEGDGEETGGAAPRLCVHPHALHQQLVRPFRKTLHNINNIVSTPRCNWMATFRVGESKSLP
eukprot:1193378-Prorocentrum_minimum.AAC.2